jgi:hypothetical protein
MEVLDRVRNIAWSYAHGVIFSRAIWKALLTQPSARLAALNFLIDRLPKDKTPESNSSFFLSFFFFFSFFSFFFLFSPFLSKMKFVFFFYC